jgi:outer membrane lipoprotein
MKKQLKFWLLLSASIAISACSSVPQSLRVDENVSLTAIGDVRANPGENNGRKARWGGVIAKIENLADKTMVEVVSMELNSSSRPKVSNETEGRFRVYVNGLLDPIIYQVGKNITVLGETAGTEMGKIGEHEYQYPLLNSSSVYLWKDVEQNNHHLAHDSLWFRPQLWGFYSPRYYRRFPPTYTPKVKANTTQIQETKNVGR